MTSAGELAFDSVDVTLHHKVDVDPGEDGCIGELEIVLKRGTGCTLAVEAAGTLTAAGALLLEQVEFSANSQCADFPDAQEGDYFDTGGMTTAEAVLSTVEVGPDNVPDWCFLSTVTLHLEGTLYSPGAGGELTVDKSSIVLAGNFLSLGNSDLMCPCVPDCQDKECGGNGCGGDCGDCPEGPYSCLDGNCVCQPQCDDNECGDDKCGGECGTCSEFYSCDAGQCLPDGTCSCNGKECGDDGCGSSCGECPPGPYDCQEGGCVCAPQCEGKECGSDGCGEKCGQCPAEYGCSAGQCVQADCQQQGLSIQGELSTSAVSLTFDSVSAVIIHKLDVDEVEAGCISSVELEFKKGTGCILNVKAGGAFDLDGFLQIEEVSFSADSMCPDVLDEAEGTYVDVGALETAAIELGLSEVPVGEEPWSCFNSFLTVHLAGVLHSPDTGADLAVYQSSIQVSGDFTSIGDQGALCPCQPSCADNECGDAGCGQSCGECQCGEECQAGECVFTACEEKECGGDGCGGICGECGCGENCENGQCVFHACDGKNCGEDGCGGSCGTCECGEECIAGQCDFTACDLKECGADGCGGICECPDAQDTCVEGICICLSDCSGQYDPLIVKFEQDGQASIDAIKAYLFLQTAGSPTCLEINPGSLPIADKASPELNDLMQSWKVSSFADLGPNNPLMYTVVATGYEVNGPVLAWGCYDVDALVEFGKGKLVTVVLHDAPPPTYVGTYHVVNHFSILSALPPEVDTVLEFIVGFFNSPTAGLLQLTCALANDALEDLCDNVFQDPNDPDINNLTTVGNVMTTILDGILINLLEDNVGTDIWSGGKDIGNMIKDIEIHSTIKIKAEPDETGFISMENTEVEWHTVSFQWTMGEDCNILDPECGKKSYSFNAIGQDVAVAQFTAQLDGWMLGQFYKLIIQPHALDLKYGAFLNFAIEKLLLPTVAGDGSDGLPVVDSYEKFFSALMGGKECLQINNCCELFAQNVSGQAGNWVQSLAKIGCQALVPLSSEYLRDMLTGLDPDTGDNFTIGTKSGQPCVLYDTDNDQVIDQWGKKEPMELRCYWDVKLKLGGSDILFDADFWGVRQ